LKQVVEKLDIVQRGATKVIWGYRVLSYEEKLKRFGLATLEKRRSRVYLI